MREHIHAAHLIHLISCRLDRFQIPRKAGWFAGHINHVADAKIQNLSDRLRMDSVARRIQNDQIRLFFQLLSSYSYLKKVCDLFLIYYINE